MLAEISEQDATGDVAQIYADVRHLWGVPYVSALYRHLATRPGVLEWAWSTIGPAFIDGTAQEAAWKLADSVDIDPLPPIPLDALAAWGLDARAIREARQVAEGFTRVSPVNLVFSAVMRRLLRGEVAGRGAAAKGGWSSPAPLPAPPPMLAFSDLDATTGAVLMRFATMAGGEAFVPGLYRQLAHWPHLLAHLAVVLDPRIGTVATADAFDEVRSHIDGFVNDLFTRMPPPFETRPPPSEGDAASLLEVIETYRRTSPEMVIFGRLIRDALPEIDGQF
jgi:hypothetical protein